MAQYRRSDNWIQTYTGRKFWPLDPRADEICLEDVAHALAMKCRYTGHCLEFYSVAQHSVIVSHLVPAEDALWGLLHDASEAYLPDVARPVKRDLVGFREIEERVMRAVAERFCLSWPEPASVKRADLVALRTERRDLMATPPIPWLTDECVEPMRGRIVAMGPERAKTVFLDRFSELTAGAAAFAVPEMNVA